MTETAEQPEQPEATEKLSLDEQKTELAELYLSFLDSQKNDILGTVSSLGASFNPLKDAARDYLLAQDKKKGILARFADNVKNAVFKKVSKDVNIDLEYDRVNLDKMKDLLKQAETTDQLNILKKQITEGKDPTTISLDNQSAQNTTTDSKTDVPISVVGSSVAAQSSIEALQDDTNRNKVVSKLDEVLAYDKEHPIKYTWGGRSEVDQGLDCSGLLIYTMQQAGFKSPGGDSRDIFNHIPTHKVDLNDPKNSLMGIKPGDPIFWNATNPKYHWSSGNIPKIEKDGSSYKIHHIAFVKDISSDGKITIVESSGSKGVTERVIDPAHELIKTKHKSELYVGQIDYDNLLAYQAKPDEDLLAAA